MEYFITVLKDNYTNFKGRSGRKELWMFVLFASIFAFALGFIDSMLGIAPVGLSALFQIAVFVPSIAICARRLHDIGKSGRWQLLSFIPVLGWILLIIFFCTGSDTGNNQFGISDKYSHENDENDDDFGIGEEE